MGSEAPALRMSCAGKVIYGYRVAHCACIAHADSDAQVTSRGADTGGGIAAPDGKTTHLLCLSCSPNERDQWLKAQRTAGKE